MLKNWISSINSIFHIGNDDRTHTHAENTYIYDAIVLDIKTGGRMFYLNIHLSTQYVKTFKTSVYALKFHYNIDKTQTTNCENKCPGTIMTTNKSITNIQIS